VRPHVAVVDADQAIAGIYDFLSRKPWTREESPSSEECDAG
jgi:hypothetical protein